MGTNHTNASDAGAASRAGTTASPGIAADEWSRGESNPRPEPAANLTPRQVFALLRYLEADLVHRAGRELTRLSASVVAASERAGGPAGCTDAFEALAWLEQAAARKAVADTDAARCEAVSVEGRVLACIEAARKAWSPHHAYSLSPEQWEFLRKLFALDGVALRVAPEVRRMEADLACEKRDAQQCWDALEEANIGCGFGERKALTAAEGIRVLALERDEARTQRDQVAHERDEMRHRMGALESERSKFLELLAAARNARAREQMPHSNSPHPIWHRLYRAMDALAGIELDPVARATTGPSVKPAPSTAQMPAATPAEAGQEGGA